MLEGLNEAIDGMGHRSIEVRILAVCAELEERIKEKRGATQAEIARRYRVSERTLRNWVDRAIEHGAEGLYELEGRGAKPRHPPEDVREIIRACLSDTGSGKQGSGEACEACEAGKGGRKAKPPPPGPCPCRGRCRALRRRGAKAKKECECGNGRACACRCCRPTRLRPKGPRHAPGCPGGRVSPANGTSTTLVIAAMKDKLGDAYCPRHVRRIMTGMNMTRRHITRRHVNRASRDKVARWQGRLRTSLEKYEEDGWTIFVHDEAHVVHDRKNGIVWGPRGERTTLPLAISGKRVTMHASISTDGEAVIEECTRADAFTFGKHIEGLLRRHDKVLVVTDNLSAHTSRDLKNIIRRLHRKYPGKRVRVRTLPVGSPYLSVVEQLWNMLKAILLARYHYPTFDEMRWDIDDFAKNTATTSLDAMEYLFRDPSLYAVG